MAINRGILRAIGCLGLLCGASVHAQEFNLPGLDIDAIIRFEPEMPGPWREPATQPAYPLDLPFNYSTTQESPVLSGFDDAFPNLEENMVVRPDVTPSSLDIGQYVAEVCIDVEFKRAFQQCVDQSPSLRTTQEWPVNPDIQTGVVHIGNREFEVWVNDFGDRTLKERVPSSLVGPPSLPLDNDLSEAGTGMRAPTQRDETAPLF